MELSLEVATALHTSFALVLTEHRYSITRNYQIIVPIVSTRDSIGEYDVHVSSQTWMRVFDGPANAVVLPIPITMSVWHSDDIARETEYVVDDETLAEVDRRLCAYFSLPSGDVGSG